MALTENLRRLRGALATLAARDAPAVPNASAALERTVARFEHQLGAAAHHATTTPPQRRAALDALAMMGSLLDAMDPGALAASAAGAAGGAAAAWSALLDAHAAYYAAQSLEFNATHDRDARARLVAATRARLAGSGLYDDAPDLDALETAMRGGHA